MESKAYLPVQLEATNPVPDHLIRFPAYLDNNRQDRHRIRHSFHPLCRQINGICVRYHHVWSGHGPQPVWHSFAPQS